MQNAAHACNDTHLSTADLNDLARFVSKGPVDMRQYVDAATKTAKGDMAKGEAHRLEMAERAWQEMTANNARECRNCHSYDAMAFHLQSRRGREKMEEGKLRNTPCIECHKGVAHKRPAIPRDD